MALRMLSRTAFPLTKAAFATQPLCFSSVRRLYTTQASDDITARIEKVIKAEPLVVFMKGVPSAPQCGFSKAVMQILDMHGVKKFTSFNVLEDYELREAIKKYSNWPTIPQVYIKGDFVGGCDIVINLHTSGELGNLLKDAGIESSYKPEDSE